MTNEELRELPMDEWFVEVMGRQFWTDLEEMVEDIREYGYRVEEYNDEYVAVENDHDEHVETTVLYLGHANRTIWIDNVRNI